jgi:gamma-glutamyltranspeptidase/glutathione hydrolase
MNSSPVKYAIASCTNEATSAGIKVAEAGGTAIDIAVAVAFDLLVSNPLMCSIGGGGFAIIKSPDGTIVIIDFYDNMPGKGLDSSAIYENIKNSKKVFVDASGGIDILVGRGSTGVPGTVKGLDYINKKFGTMPLSELLRPAIDHARKGIAVNSFHQHVFEESIVDLDWISQYEKDILLTPDGKVPPKGYILKQTDLANTLELIAKEGSDVIYKGDIARAIVKDMEEKGGLVTMEDLATYEAIERPPIVSHFKYNSIYTNPPPSSGGVTLIEMLNIAANHPLSENRNPRDNTILGKIQRFALLDKYTRFLNPETHELVSKQMLSKDYAFESYKKIVPSPHTTHFSCVDDTGWAIGITMSMGYDSGEPIPGTGIFMDNVLGEVDINPRGYLKTSPGTRLISGMTPTIMINRSNDDIVVMGSAGASRIPTCIMQIILNMKRYNMSITPAVYIPRFHFENNTFSLEPGIEIDTSLLGDDVEIVKYDRMDMFFGGAECVMLMRGEVPIAATDPRRSGSAIVFIT